MIATTGAASQPSAWEGIAAAAAGLLLVGSVAGNVALSRRRAARRTSIYDALRRRLDDPTPAGRDDAR